MKLFKTITLFITLLLLGATFYSCSDDDNTNNDDKSINYVIRDLEITIKGDDLTEDDKKAISEKYLATIPVKVKGGYKFSIESTLPIEKQDITVPLYYKGSVTIYPDVYGDKGLKTTFVQKPIQDYFPEFDFHQFSVYEIVIDQETRTFILAEYKPSTREGDRLPMALIENITSKVQKEYPNAELVYTSQVIDFKD